MRGSAVFLIAVLPAALLGCGDSSETSEGRSVRDSAGVEIVSLSPAPDGSLRFVTGERPLLSIGGRSEDIEELFSNLTAAVRLQNGRIAVADGAAAEIRLFSPTGDWVATAGREGEGPGEFDDLAFLAQLEGDSLLAFDRGLQRVSIFTRDGDFVRSWSTSSSNAPVLLYPGGATSDGDFVTTGFVGEEPRGEGSYLTAEEVGRFSDGGENYEIIDTIHGSELAQFNRGGRMMPAVVPFARKSDVAVADGHVFLLNAERPRSIQVHDASGELIRILRFETVQTEVDRELTEHWIESFFEQYNFAAPSVAEMWREGFEEVTPPAQVPLFRTLEVDREGNVCAERYQLLETAPRVFWCLSPEGDFLREVQLPANVKRPSGLPQRDPQPGIGERQFLGILLDEMDVERVDLLPLERGGIE